MQRSGMPVKDNVNKPTATFIPPMYNRPENMRWFEQEREAVEGRGEVYMGPSAETLARCEKVEDANLPQMFTDPSGNRKADQQRN